MVCMMKDPFFKSKRFVPIVLLLALFFGCVVLLLLNPLRSEKWNLSGLGNVVLSDEEALRQDAEIAFGVVPCRDNFSCQADQFCNLDVSSTGYSHEQRPQTGYCRSNQAKKTTNGWILSVFYMDFWSVDHFCASHGLKRVSFSDFDCTKDDISQGRCNTPVLERLYRQLKAYYVWGDRIKDEQYAYNIDLSSGTINFDFKDNAGHALCQ